MRRIFIDMDGVVVDFERYMRDHNLTAAEVKEKPGAYFEMLPISGALTAVRALLAMKEFEVWIATKPPTGVAHAYSDKAAWIFKHIPELSNRIIITHDKGLLGGPADFLIDDRPHKANCEEFSGQFITFPADTFEAATKWKQLVEYFEVGVF